MSEQLRSENVYFLEYAIKRVWMAAGASELHADYVADAITFAHIQGKLNQGLGVYEAIHIALEMGLLDILATPEVISEGPTWATVDGNRSSGYWTLNMMADLAIEKARSQGIAIVFGGNHNDAGSFARYVYKAFEQDMMAFSSNNTVPLAAPFGGLHNKLSCPPFDAISPAGSKNPIWTSVALAEFYDADISEAAIHEKRLKGKWLIDPVTGALSDDVRPYAQPIEGMGRVWDCSAAGQIETPRTYALNMWNEAMTAIINPIGIPSIGLPTIEEIVSGGNDVPSPSVGGSYYLCINPAVFGSIDNVKAKSDDYVAAIENCQPRPGHSVRVPGAQGYQFINSDAHMVDVFTHHWDPFFVNIAGQYGLSEQQLREDFSHQ
ncbi:MAG: malate/L-lactate dehydrogenase subfamily protein [Gammaproteobacteria bacterium]|jgi:LDH2 family malate/lactate/ureidoglycolate dehydrogenase|nr:malate/L-lactate dehydrogenase subfamily protein [Gammaproteobacteria bacterium]MBT5203947.1 malate/L-lactate dehydrogenase subfamily protein [Gammaproteobacteria bacterium]MBT5602217.1 malate/L-lactate dehydrogenase subfamily protein [Gammaproteobacteria bacterium]MBT6246028.1 malate/L-lactate dehydrogenase subfamily protein [Gammaproteobacteria bacterium]